MQKSDITEGVGNGTIKVKGTDVNVHGLGSAAYTASTSYATAAQGAKADTAYQKPSGGIPTNDIADLAITEGKIAAGAVTNGKLGDNAVTADKIQNNAVTANKLATSAVTETKIADGAVSENKLNEDSVSTNKLCDGAVTIDKISGTAIETIAASTITVIPVATTAEIELLFN